MSGTIHQQFLDRIVRDIFVGDCIASNVRKGASVKNPSSNKFLEIDVFVQKKKIGFEFQDAYHYVSTWYNQTPLQVIQSKDSLKYELVRKKGETLIIVPCWWEGGEQSLKATLEFQRPDLFSPSSSPSLSPSFSHPIPLNPPLKFFYGTIPIVGEMMLASMPEPSSTGQPFLDPPFNKWWLGEKYDGVRCCWNPIHSTLYSRRGAELPLLESFSSHFPKDYLLDGEIWFGRGLNSEAQRLLRHPEDTPWNNLRIIAFDCPAPWTREWPFEARYELILSIPFSNPFLSTATRINSMGPQQIAQFTQFIIKDAGEGLMVRLRGSPYLAGRSSALFKLKAMKGELEALVVKSESSSVLVRLPDGVTFSIQIEKDNEDSQVDKLQIPQKGDIVTVTYDDYSHRNRPTNPRIFRVRKDVTWQHVVDDYKRDTSSKELNVATKTVLRTTRKGKSSKMGPLGDNSKAREMRNYLEKFMKNQGKDPLLPETWYSTVLYSIKGVAYMCARLKMNYVELVMSLFPEIGLDESKFHVRPNFFWKNQKNRRAFFDAFAKSKDFDALIPKNWYSFTVVSFAGIKGSASVLNYYGGSLIKALLHLYPNIGLNEKEFVHIRNRYWLDLDNRRKLLEKFATLNNFDPLVPPNWYRVLASQIEEQLKGGQSMLAYYSGSLYKALSHLYPSLAFDETKFIRTPRYHWREAKNTRNFLDNFAKEHQFDPLVADNWYPISTLAIKKAKGRGILKYYKNLGRAISQIYPEVEFDISKFRKISKS